jgi:hypothetical protein
LFDIYQGELSPKISDVIKIGGVVQNLTGATVKFRMRAELSATLKVDASALLAADPTTGGVSYSWAGTDTDTAGDYLGWWVVTLSGGGQPQSTSEFPIRVNAHAPQSAALCSLLDVRAFLEIPPSDLSRDDKIGELIPDAAKAIQKETSRQFTYDAGPTTHRFQAYPSKRTADGAVVVDLNPYDLNTPTAVVLNAEVSPGTTLVADSQYTTQPTSKPDGVTTYLLLSPYQVLNSAVLQRFGFCYLDVTGSWGFTTVPNDIRRAATLTVASWVRSDVAQMGFPDAGNIPGYTPPMPGFYTIPPAALRLLNPYRRSQFF